MIPLSKLDMKPFSFGTSDEPNQNLGIAAETKNRDIQLGVWESGPGVLNLDFNWSETVYILDGRAEIENRQTGEVFELTQGMIFLFESGTRWQWRIPWKLKKVFTIVDLN
jgi:uncharacterized cupin superfamily protein